MNSANFISQCAWCRRVRMPDGTYTKQPVVLRLHKSELTISHGICPRCAAVERDLCSLERDLGERQPWVKEVAS